VTGQTVIMLTAWRRPYYLEPVLASWARADGIDRVSRLVIALGRTDRYDQQIALIRRMTRQFPCPVEIAEQSPEAVAAPSAHRAIAEGINGVFADPDTGFVVFGEEDLLVSSDVLAYMEWAREKFADDPRVLCVCGHNRGGSGWDPPVPLEEADADQHAVRLLPYFSGWVNGFWRDRWEKILEPSWDWDATSGGPATSGWDWAIQLRLIPSGNYLCVVPDASRSQNIGQFEGGYAHPDKYQETVSQSWRPAREPGGYELVTA
jgi:hypothetical protein